MASITAALVALLLGAVAAPACEIQDVGVSFSGSGADGAVAPGDTISWTLYARGEGASSYGVTFQGQSRSGTIDPDTGPDSVSGAPFTVPDLGPGEQTLTVTGAINGTTVSKPVRYAPRPAPSPAPATASQPAPASEPDPAAQPAPAAQQVSQAADSTPQDASGPSAAAPGPGPSGSAQGTRRPGSRSSPGAVTRRPTTGPRSHRPAPSVPAALRRSGEAASALVDAPAARPATAAPARKNRPAQHRAETPPAAMPPVAGVPRVARDPFAADLDWVARADAPSADDPGGPWVLVLIAAALAALLVLAGGTAGAHVRARRQQPPAGEDPFDAALRELLARPPRSETTEEHKEPLVPV